MRILFVAHNALSSNSGNHVTQIANALAKLGLRTAIAVPDADFAPEHHVEVMVPVIRWSEAPAFRFEGGAPADIVHAWTPRQHVSAATRRIANAHGARYAVHLEDNEHFLAAAHAGISVEQLLRRATKEGLELPESFAHPSDMQDFLQRAAGVSALIDALLEFKPPEVEGAVFWPAAEPIFRPAPADEALRLRLGIDPVATVLVYHGNSHMANAREIRSLYLAVAARNAARRPTVLVRLGADHAQVVPPELKELNDHVIHVPFQPRSELPRYLALADVLVQPGKPDEFNRYRFPSKLPEFLAMGKPTILPATNIGLAMRDGQDALLLKLGNAIEIVRAIDVVLASPERAAKLARGARQFYESHLAWNRATGRLIELYEKVMKRG